MPDKEITSLRQLSRTQVRSGVAAWLGWMFDGLDMHLYTLVGLAFVAQLMHTPEADPMVARHASIIQAAFLVGWALGGGFFGRLGDVLGRSRPWRPCGARPQAPDHGVWTQISGLFTARTHNARPRCAR